MSTVAWEGLRVFSLTRTLPDSTSRSMVASSLGTASDVDRRVRASSARARLPSRNHQLGPASATASGSSSTVFTEAPSGCGTKLRSIDRRSLGNHQPIGKKALSLPRSPLLPRFGIWPYLAANREVSSSPRGL